MTNSLFGFIIYIKLNLPEKVRTSRPNESFLESGGKVQAPQPEFGTETAARGRAVVGLQAKRAVAELRGNKGGNAEKYFRPYGKT